MATKPENTFRTGIHKHLPPDVHREKMSNPYSSGTADDWYSGVSGDLWVEYKYIPRLPQRVSVKIAKELSALQLRWLSGRHREGRNVAVIFGSPTGGVILRDGEWEREEMDLKEFTSRLLSRADLAAWIGSQTKGKSC